jgi:DNA-binding MarR family transcriptional regulator
MYARVCEKRAGPRRGSTLDTKDVLGYRIMHLAALMARQGELAVKRDIGLPQAQWRVLLQLSVGGPQNPNVIALETGLLRSHVTNALHELRASRLVAEKADRKDGRRILVSLSKAGQKLVDEGIQAHAPRRAKLLESLTAQERSVLDHALSKLTQAVQLMLGEAPTH